MQKTQSILEIVVNDRSYRLECSPDSPLGEVHDVLSQMKAFVIQKMQEVEKASKGNQDG